MGLFDGIKNTLRKSEAAVIVQNYLEHIAQLGILRREPAKFANDLVQYAWNQSPAVFEGKNGQKPHKISIAAVALAFGTKTLDGSDADREAVIISLGNLLNVLEQNATKYEALFHQTDLELLESAYNVLQEIAKKSDDDEEHLAVMEILESTTPDAELMNKLSITFDGTHYHYKTYKYSKYEDAENYAKQDTSR